VTAFARQNAVTHKVLLQAKGRVALVNEKGEVEWEAPCSGVAHDIQLLPNGNILTQTRANNVVEFSRDKQIVWKYEAKPKDGVTGRVEIHGFQRLQGDRTMIAETNNKRIVEVDKDGKVLKEVPLTVDKPDPHRDTRLARKLENGHYLVCHEGDGIVREYDDTGKVVWSYALDLNNRPRTPNHDGHGTEVFGAMRLPNGNTMIAGGNSNRVFEVTPEGKVVWSVEHDELPGIRLFWVTTLDLLPNGNLVVGNTHAGPDNPQLFEVTRDKKVVWTFKQFDTFGNDVAAGRVADKPAKLIR
jgi:outer membrane protein assembly factor BamB